MHPFLRNTLAVIAGIVLGSAVNMALIMVSGSVIPPPEGADVTTMEGLRASLHLFEFRHFIFPFLAHAFGTFAGAYVTARIVSIYKIRWALFIGVWFLAGGIGNIYLLPSPLWFSVVDLVFAYLPMAYLAGWLAGGRRTGPAL